MTTLSNLLDEYQKVYTEWCRFGMPDCIVKWHQGQGGARFVKRPKEIIDIHKCCETGKYIDTSKPWIYYDKANDHIKIYCVHWKVKTQILFFDVRRSILPKQELMHYAQQRSLSLDIIQGRFAPEDSKNADVVVLSGKHADFIKAGWEEMFQAELCKKEQEAAAYAQGCKDTVAHLKASTSAIEHAYNSAAMNAMVTYKCGHGKSAVFLSNQWYYTLSLHGVTWSKLSGASYYDPTLDYHNTFYFDDSWFMPFSEIGFDYLQTEEQLFCFAAAMFCRKNGILPAEMNADNIIWNCKIESKSTYTGATINNPRFKPKEEPAKPLKPIF